MRIEKKISGIFVRFFNFVFSWFGKYFGLVKCVIFKGYCFYVLEWFIFGRY